MFWLNFRLPARLVLNKLHLESEMQDNNINFNSSETAKSSCPEPKALTQDKLFNEQNVSATDNAMYKVVLVDGQLTLAEYDEDNIVEENVEQTSESNAEIVDTDNCEKNNSSVNKNVTVNTKMKPAVILNKLVDDHHADPNTSNKTRLVLNKLNLESEVRDNNIKFYSSETVKSSCPEPKAVTEDKHRNEQNVSATDSAMYKVVLVDGQLMLAEYDKDNIVEKNVEQTSESNAEIVDTDNCEKNNSSVNKNVTVNTKMKPAVILNKLVDDHHADPNTSNKTRLVLNKLNLESEVQDNNIKFYSSETVKSSCPEPKAVTEDKHRNEQNVSATDSAMYKVVLVDGQLTLAEYDKDNIVEKNVEQTSESNAEIVDTDNCEKNNSSVNENVTVNTKMKPAVILNKLVDDHHFMTNTSTTDSAMYKVVFVDGQLTLAEYDEDNIVEENVEQTSESNVEIVDTDNCEKNNSSVNENVTVNTKIKPVVILNKLVDDHHADRNTSNKARLVLNKLNLESEMQDNNIKFNSSETVKSSCPEPKAITEGKHRNEQNVSATDSAMYNVVLVDGQTTLAEYDEDNIVEKNLEQTSESNAEIVETGNCEKNNSSVNENVTVNTIMKPVAILNKLVDDHHADPNTSTKLKYECRIPRRQSKNKNRKKCVVCGRRKTVGTFMARIPNISVSRCYRWVKHIGIPELVDIPIQKLDLKLVCGRHFKPSAFRSGIRGVGILFKDAYPTLEMPYLPLTDEQMKDFPLHCYKPKNPKDYISSDHNYCIKLNPSQQSRPDPKDVDPPTDEIPQTTDNQTENGNTGIKKKMYKMINIGGKVVFREYEEVACRPSSAKEKRDVVNCDSYEEDKENNTILNEVEKSSIEDSTPKTLITELSVKRANDSLTVDDELIFDDFLIDDDVPLATNEQAKQRELLIYDKIAPNKIYKMVTVDGKVALKEHEKFGCLLPQEKENYSIDEHNKTCDSVFKEPVSQLSMNNDDVNGYKDSLTIDNMSEKDDCQVIDDISETQPQQKVNTQKQTEAIHGAQMLNSRLRMLSSRLRMLSSRLRLYSKHKMKSLTLRLYNILLQLQAEFRREGLKHADDSVDVLVPNPTKIPSLLSIINTLGGISKRLSLRLRQYSDEKFKMKPLTERLFKAVLQLQTKVLREGQKSEGDRIEAPQLEPKKIPSLSSIIYMLEEINNNTTRLNYVSLKNNLQVLSKFKPQDELSMIEEGEIVDELLELRNFKEKLYENYNSAQIYMMLNPMSRKALEWSEEDLQNAAYLKSIVSSQAYTFLTKQLRVPLPRDGILNRYIKEKLNLKSNSSNPEEVNNCGNNNDSGNVNVETAQDIQAPDSSRPPDMDTENVQAVNAQDIQAPDSSRPPDMDTENAQAVNSIIDQDPTQDLSVGNVCLDRTREEHPFVKSTSQTVAYSGDINTEGLPEISEYENNTAHGYSNLHFDYNTHDVSNIQDNSAHDESNNAHDDGNIQDNFVHDHNNMQDDCNTHYNSNIPGDNNLPSDAVPVQEKITRIDINDIAKKHRFVKFKCELCQRPFETKEELREHVPVHYFNSLYTNYLDIKREKTTKSYHCDFCREPLHLKSELVQHHRMHLGINELKCWYPGCLYIGKTRDALSHHMTSHRARTLACPVCGAQFAKLRSLREHIARLHEDRTPRTCALCRGRARNVFTYRKHMRSHDRPPRFKCGEAGCGAAFYSRADLGRHKLRHKGLSADDSHPYKCPLCPFATYTQAAPFNRHMERHKDTKLINCFPCKLLFHDYGDFYTHLTTAHKRTYTCVCSASFNTNKKLNIHKSNCEQAMATQSNEPENEQPKKDKKRKKKQDNNTTEDPSVKPKKRKRETIVFEPNTSNVTYPPKYKPSIVSEDLTKTAPVIVKQANQGNSHNVVIEKIETLNQQSLKRRDVIEMMKKNRTTHSESQKHANIAQPDMPLIDLGDNCGPERHVEQNVENVERNVQYIAQNVPHVDQNVQYNAQNVPHVEQNIQYNAQNVPHVEQNVPHFDQNVQYNAQNVPHVEQNVQNNAQNVPHVEQNVLHVDQNVQYNAQNVPHVEQNVQYNAQNVPHVEQNVQNIAQNVPHVQQNVKYVIQKVQNNNQKVQYVVHKLVKQ